MKREGRQHGMVRSYRILPSSLNPRPDTRIVTRFDSLPTAGLFVKVSSKPTNHSKFTGKCGTPRCTGCHLHPACKSKGKTKGSQKHKLWRVIDEPDSDFFGLSEDDCDWEKKDDNKFTSSEKGVSFRMDQVQEEKEEDWLLVEPCL
ncbi:uncharacterized protein LOC114185936 [Vigna unguiculata]|uniref:Uncharacterized protein n=1 Tax=Vigna unguiculata TaxID=3917 RepID=A0A4D6NFA5_VIGUN|nr:uncharacterized protein LOC114185936 [Vigna unguiculata]QCE10865.1 hypothetical protein DEO72_LG10g2097 [Vigna unguiculata]